MTKDEKAHLSKVAALGCIACFIQGTPGTPAEIHHPRAGSGMGQRASHYDGIPLCPAHHRGTMHPKVTSIHLARIDFIDQFGTEQELLKQVRHMVGAND